ncbi:MAG: GNAT family N-acetyltransferase [Aggregatilineales bacterium]
MTNYPIRDANADDFETIKQMVKDARLDPLGLKWQNFLVVEHDGQIIAIAQIRRHRGCNELGSLITLHDYQKQGIAGQLMSKIEKRTGSPLYLVCMNKMKPYYERYGYQEIRWHEIPNSLRVKLAPAMPLRLFGIRVIAMRKTWI